MFNGTYITITRRDDGSLRPNFKPMKVDADFSIVGYAFGVAKELIKAFRYDSFDDVVRNTKENVVDEVADVLIVLDHVLQLFNITPEDLQPHIDKKLQRLEYWLNNSNSIEFTTRCRTVDTENTAPVPEREDIPYDAFGDYSEEPEKLDLSELIKTQKGVYENRFLRLFEMGDKLYREGQE